MIIVAIVVTVVHVGGYMYMYTYCFASVVLLDMLP